jgi:hypothetical protein
MRVRRGIGREVVYASLCDDMQWVSDAINESMGQEIQWPDASRRVQLSQRGSSEAGSIGHLEGTLGRIKLASDVGADHRRHRNGRKHIYC